MNAFYKLFTLLKKIFIGYTTPPCVGIDISSSAIKMVELKHGSLIVNKFSIVPLEKNAVSEGVINNIEYVSEIVRSQWEKLNSDYRQVSIAIPYNSVIIKEIKTPILKSRYQLDAFVLEFLIKELDTEDIDFDYNILKQANDEQILSVVVARKEKIEEYQAIIQMTGMSVAAIDVEPFAIQHLFAILLKNSRMDKPVIVIDLGSTRIRAYVLFEHTLVSFSEISVNYYPFLEELIANDAAGINITKILAIDDYVFNNMVVGRVKFKKLADAIIYDINKLLQLVRSNILVERKMNLADNIDLYFIGGNVLIPGVIDEFSLRYSGKITMGSELLARENPHISNIEIMRLFSAIALATWGQRFEKN